MVAYVTDGPWRVTEHAWALRERRTPLQVDGIGVAATKPAHAAAPPESPAGLFRAPGVTSRDIPARVVRAHHYPAASHP